MKKYLKFLIVALLAFPIMAFALIPLSVNQGGTGVNTITGIIKGNGTAPFSPITIGTGLQLVGSTLSATTSGTVSSFSFTDGNGFDGTVTNSTTTPTLSLTTQLTAGSIPFIGVIGGALTQDNANLYFDNLDNLLGIGTNSPGFALDVLHSGSQLAKFESTDDEAYVKIYGSTIAQLDFRELGASDDAHIGLTDSGFFDIASPDRAINITTSSIYTGGGTPTYTVGANNIINAIGNTNSYYAMDIQNLSSGTTASTDIIINANNATDTTNYLDIGIASSGNTDSNYTFAGAGEAYMYSQSSNLAFATATANKAIKFFAGGTLTANEIARFTPVSSAGVAGSLLVGTTSTNTGGRIYAVKNLTGLTAGSGGIIRASDTSTYNTTGGAMSTSSGYFNASGTRTAGSNNLVNVAAYFQAINGDVNTAIMIGGGNIAVDTATATARLFFATGQTTAGTAPIKLTGVAGVLATPEAGAIEMTSAGYVSGSHLYWTDSAGTRQQLDGAGTPPGVDTNIIFNDGGSSFGATSDFNYNQGDRHFTQLGLSYTSWIDSDITTQIINLGDVNGDNNGTYIALDDGANTLTLASGRSTIYAPYLILGGTDATGDIWYRGTGGAMTRLGIGSSGQVLTVSAGIPSWATPTTGTVTSVSGTANRITSTGGATPVIDISASYVGQSSITTLGTIATGTWNGSLITGTYGGTGVNNGSKTFTYLKNMSFTAADDTGVYTLPTGTKTLVATDVTTLSSLASIGTITTGVWNGTTIAFANGGTGLTSASDDQMMISSGSAWVAKTIPDCTDTGGNHLNYTQSTNTLSCGTSSSGGGGGLTVGTTTITSGTNTKVLFDNSGVLGEYTISGSGNVAMTTSPSFTTPTLGAASYTTLSGGAITNSSLTSGRVTFATTSGLMTDDADFTFATDTLTVTKIAATTLSGTATLAENSSIALDPAGSADGKYTGTTVAATAGYTQAFGDLVYLDPTDSRWEQVDANSAQGADGDARGIIGMVVSAGTDGNPCIILLQGIIRADAKFPTFTVNNQIYASETAGAVTGTQPTTADVVIRVVGVGITADEMYFNPSMDYITHI